jgi:N-acetylneuraminic acid mutarotase
MCTSRSQNCKTTVSPTGSGTTSSAGFAYVQLKWTLVPTRTSLSVTAPTTPPQFGETVTLHATVTATGTTYPTGLVRFYATGTHIQATGCTATTALVHGPTNGKSTAACSYRLPEAVSAPKFAATFVANNTYAGSTGAAQATVHKDTTTIGAVSVTAKKFPPSLTLSVTVYPAGYTRTNGTSGYAPTSLGTRSTGTGKLTFYATGGALTCNPTPPEISTAATPGGAASATCRFTGATPGKTYTFTAKYAGAGENTPAGPSSAVHYSLHKVTPSISISLSPGSTKSPVFGQSVTVVATVKTIPASDSSPPDVTLEATGKAIDCIGTTQTNPLGAKGGTCTFVPGRAGTLKSEVVVATYPGDGQTNATSSTLTITVAKATATTTLKATPTSTGALPVGALVTLVATVTDANTYPGTPVDGSVTFAGTGVSGCTAVKVASGVAKCSVTVPTARTAALSFSATYCPTGAGGNCADWNQSTSNTVTAKTGPDPTSVTLSPTAPQTNPYTLPGGEPVTITATVRTTAGHEPVTGTVAFKENGQAISSCGGKSGEVTGATGAVTCTFTPIADNEDTVVATYSPAAGNLTAASTSAPWYVKVSGKETTTNVLVASSAAYGVPTPAMATVTVTTTSAKVPVGTVSFLAGGQPVPSCSAQPVDATGRATCTISPSVLPAGTTPVTITADYAYAGGTYAKSSGSATLKVNAAPTSASISIGPTSATTDLVTVTLKNTATGAIVAPTGTVTVSEGSHSCTGTLTPSSGPSAVATCSLPRPVSPIPVTFTATYSPSSADFQALAAPATLTFTPGAACTSTPTFTGVWTAATSEKTLSLSVDGAGHYGSVSLKLGSVSGPCVVTGTVPFSRASLDLFGQTLTSTSMSGYVAAAQGTGKPQVCLTGGSVTLPTGWSIGSIGLSSTEKLCFDLTKVTASGSPATGTVGPPNGSVTVSASSIPYAAVARSAGYQLTVSFAASPPSLSVHIGPATPPAASPYVTLTVTVTKSGTTFTASGSLTLLNLPFLGTALHGTFQVGTGTTGKIKGSVKLTVLPTTASYSPVPGLVLSGISLTLSTTTGLTIKGKAALGAGTKQFTLALTGNYNNGKWTLEVAAGSVKTWSPVTGLTLNLTLAGTVTITTAGSSAVVTYDIQAGKAPTGHSAGTSLVSWSPGGGVVVQISCVAFAFGEVPTCEGGPTSKSPTDPTLFAQGSVAFGSGSTGSGITAGFKGAVDLKTAAIDLSYDATAGPLSVSPVTGLTLTLDSLSITGNASRLNVLGSATATISAIGTTVEVTFQDETGVFVVAGKVTFKGIGVPLSGVFAYSTGTVTTFATGTPTVGSGGRVSLAKGFSAFAVYHPTGAVAAILHEVDSSLGSGAAIFFQANWAPGSKPTFSLTLSAGTGFPFLSLPDTGKLTSIVLSYGTTALTLAIKGAIPDPGAQPAPVTLTLTIGTGSKAGTFTGKASVSKLTIFGQVVTLSGSIDRAATGAITATVTGSVPGPVTPFPGVPFTLSNMTFSLGTKGISVAATMSVDTLGSLSVTGSLQKIRTWSLTVKAAAAKPWTPFAGVTLSPSFSGTVTDAAGSVTFSLTASGANGSPLLTLSPGPVTLTVSSVGLGNAAPPAGCSVSKTGDLWLSVSGSLAMTLGTDTKSVTATGCFDLTAKTFALKATLAALSFSALTGHVVLGAPTVTLSWASGTFDVQATATLTVTMPTGGSLVVRATLAFESGGTFIIGAEVNLSKWLGNDASYAYLYYASKKVTGFTTGDPSLQKIDLAQGLTFALSVSVPATVAKGLAKIGITIPAGTKLKATGTATFSSDTYKLTVSVNLGSGKQLFTSNGAKLILDTGFLQLTLSPTSFTFGLGLTATLDLPSPGAVGGASHVALTGELSISDTGINVSLSLGHCGSTTTAWITAFGASGLTVQCASLTGGITYEFPFVDVGLSGTITSLPSSIANATGYQDGAPISFAFNLDPFLLKLSIGTKDSTTPALKPLQFIGQGTLIKVYYASLYISPTGATIGPTTYPAGLSMGFQATLFGVKTSILASIGLSPPSITFTATISKITLHGLSIGPIKVVLKASPSTFEFQFTGSAQLGPGSVNIGPTLKIGGELSATVQIDLSTSKLSAFISGSLALTITAWVATQTCYTAKVFPYPCNYAWRTTGFSATLGKTGFSITSSGVTLEADGYSVTFDYNGHVSASLASLVRHRSQGSGGHGTGRAHPAPNTATLAAFVQPLPPATAPVPPPSGPRQNVGQAVLVPTPPSAQGHTSSQPPSSSTTSTNPPGTKGSTPVKPVAAAPTVGPPLGSWKPAASMATARSFSATATLDNGDILVAGGVGPGMQVLSSAEVYDPANGRWSSVGSLSTARAGASATVLDNGDVLVAGGYDSTGRPLRTAQLYHPKKGTFSKTGSLHEARAFASAVPLTGGNVLVAGGVGAGHTPLRTAEVYHATTGRFTTTGSMSTAHAFGAAVRLPGGQVLVAGGEDATGPLTTAERYDPSSGTWSSAGRMNQPRAMAAGAALQDGDVLVVGGAADGDVYDPKTGIWSATAGMPAAVTMPMVSALPDDQVLVTGGVSDGSSTRTAVLFEPNASSWRSAGSMQTAVSGAAIAGLSNGQVLVAGGGDVSATQGGGQPAVSLEPGSELYTPRATVTSALSGTTPPSGSPHGTPPSGSPRGSTPPSGSPHGTPPSGSPHGTPPSGSPHGTPPSSTPPFSTPHGSPPPVIPAVAASSALPVALASAGGVVVLAGAALWAFELRRRRRLHLERAGQPPSGPPGED